MRDAVISRRRTDARYTVNGKRASVRISNASHLGYSLWTASPDDFVTFEVPTNDPACTSTRHGRVIGRVDASGSDGDPVKGWIAVMALGTNLSFAYEMWIDPAWVTECHKIGPETLEFFRVFLSSPTNDLIRMSEYGSLGASPGRTNQLPPTTKG